MLVCIGGVLNVVNWFICIRAFHCSGCALSYTHTYTHTTPWDSVFGLGHCRVCTCVCKYVCATLLRYQSHVIHTNKYLYLNIFSLQERMRDGFKVHTKPIIPFLFGVFFFRSELKIDEHLCMLCVTSAYNRNALDHRDTLRLTICKSSSMSGAVCVKASHHFENIHFSEWNWNSIFCLTNNICRNNWYAYKQSINQSNDQFDYNQWIGHCSTKELDTKKKRKILVLFLKNGKIIPFVKLIQIALKYIISNALHYWF